VLICIQTYKQTNKQTKLPVTAF